MNVFALAAIIGFSRRHGSLVILKPLHHLLKRIDGATLPQSDILEETVVSNHFIAERRKLYGVLGAIFVRCVEERLPIVNSGQVHG